MLTAALLALSLSHATVVQPSKLDQLARPAVVEQTPSNAVAVVLDCQIAAKSLTDCKAVGDADSSVTAEAIRMAATVQVPDALAESGARIRIRMNVTP